MRQIAHLQERFCDSSSDSAMFSQRKSLASTASTARHLFDGGLLHVQRALVQLETDQPVRLGPLHYLRMRLMEGLMDAAPCVGAMGAALAAATALLPYYRTVFPKVRVTDPSTEAWQPTLAAQRRITPPGMNVMIARHASKRIISISMPARVTKAAVKGRAMSSEGHLSAHLCLTDS